eukprot:scaffold5901_cov116-Cylindrotheca_fusiformis.AAC.10
MLLKHSNRRGTTRVTRKVALAAGSSMQGKARRASRASNCVLATIFGSYKVNRQLNVLLIGKNHRFPKDKRDGRCLGIDNDLFGRQSLSVGECDFGSLVEQFFAMEC